MNYSKEEQSRIEDLRSEIVDIGRNLHEKNYICATEGNISARLPDGRILITPAGVNKGYLDPAKLVLCRRDGTPIDGHSKPSSEIKLHISVYHNRNDVMAVCHAHPVFATSYSVAGIPLNKAVLPEIVGSLGAIPIVKYAPPGSDELAEKIKHYLTRYDAFLLESHGAVALGRSCREAYDRLESVERFAQILYCSTSIGEPKLLSRGETDRLLKLAGRGDIKSEIEFGD